jgi:hypothetical protein
MERDVRIKLSAGLLAVAVCHAVILAIVFTALHWPMSHDSPSRDLQLPPYGPTPVGEYRSAPNAAVELPPVNVAARDEIKHQANCLNCTPGTTSVESHSWTAAQQIANSYGARLNVSRSPNGIGYSVYATLDPDSQWISTGRSTTSTYIGANCFTGVANEMQRGIASSHDSPSRVPTLAPKLPPALNPAPTAPQSNRYQVALFVADDAQSQQLLSWFDSDPELRNLRANCDFQVYRPDNALYRSRYAAQVPIEQFPALLFLKPDGGHVHAAGKTMLPRRSSDLVSDIRESLELAKSAAPQPTGLIRETGYSWDNAINPQMQLQSGDCPDGWCPPDAPERPGLGGRLFDRAEERRDAMMWFGVEEIIVGLLAVLAAILIIIIAVKRR